MSNTQNIPTGTFCEGFYYLQQSVAKATLTNFKRDESLAAQ
jgi:hypothetical protein